MSPVIKIHHSCDLPWIASQGRVCRNLNPWVIPRRTHFSICYCLESRLPPNMLHSRMRVRHSSALHRSTEAGCKRKLPFSSSDPVLRKFVISCKPFYSCFSLVDCVSQFPSGVGQADCSVCTHITLSPAVWYTRTSRFECIYIIRVYCTYVLLIVRASTTNPKINIGPNTTT